MRIEYYEVVEHCGGLQPDLDHDLQPEIATARALEGAPLVVKLWLRTRVGERARLDALEAVVQAAVAPLGLV